MKKAILEFVGLAKELELEAFRITSRGEADWRVARDESLDMGEKGLHQIVEGQPLALKLLLEGQLRGLEAVLRGVPNYSSGGARGVPGVR